MALVPDLDAYLVEPWGKVAFEIVGLLLDQNHIVARLAAARGHVR